MIVKKNMKEKDIKIAALGSELSKSRNERVINFMRNVLIDDFGYKETIADGLAHCAYDKYCEGDELTEHECIKWADEQYQAS